jgi:hypothetical protein
MTNLYRVERTSKHYAIYRTGEGELVRGDDAVLLHRIVELLNDDVSKFCQPGSDESDAAAS